jgi:hypothetical protein
VLRREGKRRESLCIRKMRERRRCGGEGKPVLWKEQEKELHVLEHSIVVFDLTTDCCIVLYFSLLPR